MACVGCRSKAKGTIVVLGKAIPIPTGPDRVFEYVGTRGGQFTVNSVVQPRKKYRVRRGEPFTVPAGDAMARFSRMGDFREVLPEEAEAGTHIPNAPVQPPQIAVPNPQPAPEVAPLQELAPPARVDDLDRLELHEKIVEILRGANFHRVSDLSFDIRAGDGHGLRSIKGIAAKRYAKIVEAVQALEAA